jgi:hypothetical protein
MYSIVYITISRARLERITIMILAVQAVDPSSFSIDNDMYYGKDRNVNWTYIYV